MRAKQNGKNRIDELQSKLKVKEGEKNMCQRIDTRIFGVPIL